MFKITADLFEIVAWVIVILTLIIIAIANHSNRNRLEFYSETVTEKDVKKAVRYMTRKGAKPPFKICVVQNYNYRPLYIVIVGDTAEELWKKYTERKNVV